MQKPKFITVRDLLKEKKDYLQIELLSGIFSFRTLDINLI